MTSLTLKWTSCHISLWKKWSLYNLSIIYFLPDKVWFDIHLYFKEYILNNEWCNQCVRWWWINVQCISYRKFVFILLDECTCVMIIEMYSHVIWSSGSDRNSENIFSDNHNKTYIELSKIQIKYLPNNFREKYCCQVMCREIW